MNEQNNNLTVTEPNHSRYELLKASGALSIYEIRTNPQFKPFYDAHREAVDRINALDNMPPSSPRP